MNVNDLVKKILEGDARTLARVMSILENEDPGAEEILERLSSHIGRAYRIGITGPPGAGKSTLSGKLAEQLRADGKRVGIIAVDPTSPFSGGALLGDRIRMSHLSSDSGVFMRSMATRGSTGGLSIKAEECGDVLDAAGFDVVIFETVGVGQNELDVIQVADTVVVVLVPESGDGIQTMKAGLMEIGDIFLINKSDREGAESLKKELVQMLQMKKSGKEIPVITTIASQGVGITEAYQAIVNHRNMIEKSGELHTRRINRFRQRIRNIVLRWFEKEFWNEHRQSWLDQHLQEIATNHISPYKIAHQLINAYRKEQK